MTYQEYKEKSQKEFNELPIHFAFSQEQLDEELAKMGCTIDDVVGIGAGGFVKKSDLPIIKAYFNKSKEDKTLEELMQDHDFAVSAFRYEMDNHEYAINYYQGDWEVVSCFSKKPLEFGDDKNYKDYLYDAGMKELIPWYQEARASHFKAAEDWF